MLSCKETSRLISEGLDHALPPWKRLLVHMHLRACRTCGHYRKQITALKKIFPHYPGPGASASLPEDFRQKLKQLIKHHS